QRRHEIPGTPPSPGRDLMPRCRLAARRPMQGGAMRRIHRHLTFANAVSRTRLRAIGNQRLLLLVGLLALAAAPAPASGAKTRIVWSRFEHRTGSRLQLVSATPTEGICEC